MSQTWEGGRLQPEPGPKGAEVVGGALGLPELLWGVECPLGPRDSGTVSRAAATYRGRGGSP